MPTYTQARRPLRISTPLGADVLLLTGFRGHESISHLFDFQLDLLAERGSDIHFDRIVGQSVTVEMRLANGKTRYFNGLVKRFCQGGRDEHFTAFRAEVVPALWLLKKRVQCRIFQRKTVPAILEQVLSGFDVSYKLLGTYYERDYCVQYRESDFDFVNRLMEEEGICYFFRHSDGGHQMVVTDVGNKHPAVPGQSNITYEEMVDGLREDMRITAWEKSQELRSATYTLWDHCFELPDHHLDESVQTIDRVKAGRVVHKLDLAGDQLEIYDYPGGYAKRFDSVGHNRAARPEDMDHMFEDRSRTVRVRMEEEESASLEIAGASDCGNFTSGHQFTLQRHFDADGEYLLTRVDHDARQAGHRSDEKEAFSYHNRFLCIPSELRYRPRRVTAKPVIAGVQTATVTGPPDEEIFCDKYGRVKVQFHWDRKGKKDGDTSCWLRVAQVWAGKGWGGFFWPRVGHEVVVAFEEGDPDQPIIVGSVYNAANMPPYTLPEHDQYGGFRSASVRGSAHEHFNGIVFNDAKGHEHLSIHSQRNMSLNSELDKMFHSGQHKGERVSGAAVFTVGALPGGGGSGGGMGFEEGNAISQPAPMGIPGLNAQMIYGENMVGVAGLNYTSAFGNNVTVCINPLGVAAGTGLPLQPALKVLLGSGLGGSASFTMGTNMTFVLGQSFDLSVGPNKIEDHEDYSWAKATVPGVLCILLAIVHGLWLILHGVLGEDRTRAYMVLGFQALIDIILVILTACAAKKKLGEWEWSQRYWVLYALVHPSYWDVVDKDDWMAAAKLLGSGTALVVGALGSGLGPLGAILLETALPKQPDEKNEKTDQKSENKDQKS